MWKEKNGMQWKSSFYNFQVHSQGSLCLSSIAATGDKTCFIRIIHGRHAIIKTTWNTIERVLALGALFEDRLQLFTAFRNDLKCWLQGTYFASDNSCTYGNKGMQFLQTLLEQFSKSISGNDSPANRRRAFKYLLSVF
jgi:hypothetical protein